MRDQPRKLPLLLLLLGPLIPFGLAGQDVGPDPAQLDLDALIAELPRAGAGGHYDGEPEQWIEDPYFAEMRRRIAGGVRLTDAQWRTALRDTGAVRVRERWPVGEPFALSMRVPAWLPGCEIRMCAEDEPSLRVATASTLAGLGDCGLAIMSRLSADAHQVLGTLTAGHHSLEFQVQIERGKPSRAPFGARREDLGPAGPVWSGSMTFDVDVVPSIDDVLPPVRDARVDAAVAGSCRMRLLGDGRGNLSCNLFFHGEEPSAFEALHGLVVGVEAELHRDGEVVETRTLVAQVDNLSDPNDPERGALKGGLVFTELPVAALRAPAGWSVVLRSSTRDILRAWAAERRWDGAVTLSLAELVANSDASRGR